MLHYLPSQIFNFNNYFGELCGILGLEKLFRGFTNFHLKDKEDDSYVGVSIATLWDRDSKASKEGIIGEEAAYNLGIPQQGE